MRRYGGGYGSLLGILVVAAVVAFWWAVGTAGAQVGIDGTVTTINEAKAQTVQVAAAFVLLLGALLSIALVVMLYKRSSGSA